MKINQVKGLIDQYGEQATLGDILKKVQGNKLFKCPKCDGKGYVTVEYNCYPSGLPDSGFFMNQLLEMKNVICVKEMVTHHMNINLK